MSEAKQLNIETFNFNEGSNFEHVKDGLYYSKDGPKRVKAVKVKKCVVDMRIFDSLEEALSWLNGTIDWQKELDKLEDVNIVEFLKNSHNCELSVKLTTDEINYLATIARDDNGMDKTLRYKLVIGALGLQKGYDKEEEEPRHISEILADMARTMRES